jgi:hypothetical protein
MMQSTPPRAVLAAVVVPLLVFGASCSKVVSFHDDRILTAVPVAKMSATDLAIEYGNDHIGANRKYLGNAVEITDVVESVVTEDPAHPFIAFKIPGPIQLRAFLHDDRAAAIIATVADRQRLTLRCFSEGMTTVVILKSCVVPEKAR